MAKLKQKDLEHLTSEQIRKIYLANIHGEVLDISPIKEFLEPATDNIQRTLKLHRVYKLLDRIIVLRFLKKQLQSPEELQDSL